jgi:hypothetical protein
MTTQTQDALHVARQALQDCCSHPHTTESISKVKEGIAAINSALAAAEPEQQPATIERIHALVEESLRLPSIGTHTYTLTPIQIAYIAGKLASPIREKKEWREFIEECATFAGKMVNGNRLSMQAKALLAAPSQENRQ